MLPCFSETWKTGLAVAGKGIRQSPRRANLLDNHDSRLTSHIPSETYVQQALRYHLTRVDWNK